MFFSLASQLIHQTFQESLLFFPLYAYKMQLHSETFEIIQKTKCSIKHKYCLKLDRDWKSSLQIMFNDIFGINNLKSHTSPLLRCSWASIWLSVTLCLLLLALDVDARPTAAVSRSFNANPISSGDTLSLSIFSPLDILRQNMLLEIQRKRIRHAKQRQVQSNKEYLDRIGR